MQNAHSGTKKDTFSKGVFRHMLFVIKVGTHVVKAVRVRQGAHEFEARLLCGEVACEDDAVLKEVCRAAFVAVDGKDSACVDARGEDDGDTCFDGVMTA